MTTMVDKEPNLEQKAAIQHGKGPLLIIAGAGTGKQQLLLKGLNI